MTLRLVPVALLLGTSSALAFGSVEKSWRPSSAHPTPVTSTPNGCKAARPYFNRYTDDTIDLCDVLSSFSSPSKDALCMNFVAQMLGVKTSDGVGS
jgi:hypothetical protein